MDRTPRIPGLRRVFQLSGARHVQTDVDEELRFHLDMRTEDLVRSGVRLGIRIALGAGRANILTLIVRERAVLTVPGVSVGLIVALWATRTLGSLLCGVGAADPPTYLAVALLLGAVALVASYVPARRAARVDPMVALRAGE